MRLVTKLASFSISLIHIRYLFPDTKKPSRSKIFKYFVPSFDIFILLRLTSRESVYLLSKHRPNSLNYQMKGL